MNLWLIVHVSLNSEFWASFLFQIAKLVFNELDGTLGEKEMLIFNTLGKCYFPLSRHVSVINLRLPVY